MSAGWTGETALDVDMASAACPRCKILVVQSDDSSTAAMDLAQQTAASFAPAVISDSFGVATTGSVADREHFYDHPNITTFADKPLGYEADAARAARRRAATAGYRLGRELKRLAANDRGQEEQPGSPAAP